MPIPHRSLRSDTRWWSGRVRRPLTTTVALTAGLTLVVSACSSGSKSGSPQTSAAAPSSASSSGTTARRGPAASGEIAAVTGSTMQVQNQQTGQVAVSWTGSTAFTQQVTLTVSSIKAGDCVTAVAASGTATTATAFTATSLSLRSASGSSCDAGFPGGNGNVPGGGNGSDRPRRFPTGAFPSGSNRPSGFPTGGGRSTAIASGKVVSVSGSTVVVAARAFARPASSSSPAATPTTTDKTITVAATTKITGEQKATAAAVVVGRCASAEGKADSSGAVTATSISVTDPVDGECTTGRGGFGGAPGAPDGGGAS